MGIGVSIFLIAVGLILALAINVDTDGAVDVPMIGWISPRLGIRFEMPVGGDLVIYRPDGQRFLGYIDLVEQGERAEQERDRLAARLRARGIDPEM